MQVLDLFAGSGALGIEALSRGAAHATFVDQRKAGARGGARRTCASSALEDRATVLAGDAVALAARHRPGVAVAARVRRSALSRRISRCARVPAARLTSRPTR